MLWHLSFMILVKTEVSDGNTFKKYWKDEG